MDSVAVDAACANEMLDDDAVAADDDADDDDVHI